jgi:hypothetical protein
MAEIPSRYYLLGGKMCTIALPKTAALHCYRTCVPTTTTVAACMTRCSDACNANARGGGAPRPASCVHRACLVPKIFSKNFQILCHINF